MNSIGLQARLSATSGSARATVRMAQALMRLASALASEYRTRRAARALNELDDRMLADIGLPRAEIDTAVRWGRSAIASTYAPWFGR
jgi:uncharacterized protein YjiS (DUF1127 family)